MPPISIETKVPLDVLLTFTLNTGDTLVAQASQATSRQAMDRSRALMPKQSFASGDDDSVGKMEVIPFIERSMYDAYYASLEAEITDEEGEQLFVKGMTLARYRNVWGLSSLDEKEYIVNGYENRGRVSLRDMLMEAVYQANPGWDFLRDEESGTSSRVLYGYSQKDKKQ